jgi:predicted MFS family arabinose efflux permease
MTANARDILDLPPALEVGGSVTRMADHPAYTRLRSVLMVAICSLSLFLNNGFMGIGISAFDPLMMQRLHVSVGALKFGDTITLVTVALTAPLAGYFIDLLGARPLFLGGMSLMAAGIALYAQATSLTLIYLTHVLFGLCLVSSGAFACLIVVSAATSRWRGFAIGVLLASASLGSGIAPGILAALKTLYGLQGALYLLAGVAACTLPAIAALVPMRLHIGSTAHLPRGETATLGGALRSRNFWLLAVVAAIGYMSALGIVTNLVLFFSKDVRLSAAGIGMMMLLVFGTVLIAQLGIGLLCDVLNRRLVHTVCVFVMAVGCAILAGRSAPLLGLGLVLFGVGWGGNYVLLQYLVTHLFAGPSVGRIVGTIGVVEALGGSLGPVLIGASHDWTGSYSFAFSTAAAALSLAGLCASRINARPS